MCRALGVGAGRCPPQCSVRSREGSSPQRRRTGPASIVFRWFCAVSFLNRLVKTCNRENAYRPQQIEEGVRESFCSTRTRTTLHAGPVKPVMQLHTSELNKLSHTPPAAQHDVVSHLRKIRGAYPTVLGAGEATDSNGNALIDSARDARASRTSLLRLIKGLL